MINTTVVNYFTIDAERAGQRIDNYLMNYFKGLPKSRVYSMLRKGEVRVNKKRAKPEYRVQAGDIVRVPPVQLDIKPSVAKPAVSVLELIENAILYEDDRLMVINKPAGIAVHGGSGIQYGIIEALRVLRPKQKLLELVHRLDRDTSGCLLVAKKNSMLRYLHELLRSGKMQKTYVALVQGCWPETLTFVDVPLLKNIQQSGERVVKVNSEGKASQTAFKVIKQYADAALIEAKPLTGRTHQIRVHAAHAGHPIVGDDKYGDSVFNKHMRGFGIKQLCLHAARLEFNLEDGTVRKFEASLPEWTQVLKNHVPSPLAGEG